jgi:hypothetical protein
MHLPIGETEMSRLNELSDKFNQRLVETELENSEYISVGRVKVRELLEEIDGALAVMLAHRTTHSKKMPRN